MPYAARVHIAAACIPQSVCHVDGRDQRRAGTETAFT